MGSTFSSYEMIHLEDLSKSFDDNIAVKNLSLQVERGAILGFLGPNGAGKTTTVKMLTGMIRPTSGVARVAGFDVVEDPLEVKRKIGYVPESGALFESLTAWEYLELVSELHHLQRRIAHGRIEEFLTLLSIFEDKDRRLNSFSKGMKQKVLLSAAFLHNPEVLFLDEPLNGLDSNAALVIKEVLKRFAAQGKTIMFCSHILEVVEQICTRIAIIDKGELIIDGTSKEIISHTSQPSLEQAFYKLTGARDVHAETADFLEALERI
ncbi:MAG: ABC transporter ATP-binding protein [bacterium]